MDNTVRGVHHAIVCQSELLGILCQRRNLLGTDGVLDRLVLVVRWRIVVGHAENVVGTEALQSASPHAVKSLW